MSKIKLTPDQLKRCNELLNKVINKNISLEPDELEELHKYLEILFKIQEEKEKSYSEILDNAILRKSIELIIKRDAEIKFNKLPLSERTKILQDEIRELKNSSAFKQVQKDIEKKKEEKAFEDYYQEHVKKNGKSL